MNRTATDHRLNVEELPDRLSPAALTAGLTAVGSSTGTVTVINADSTPRFTLTPFGPDYRGEVRTAVADVNNDGVPDVIAAPGPGGRPVIAVASGVDGSVFGSTGAFEDSFRGGLFVAAGDFNGDGFADIVVAPDQGGGPRVRVLSGKDLSPLADFFAIEDTAFRGGVRPAAADLTGDGVPDLVVSAGFGGGPRVAGFAGAGGPKLFPDFFAFEPALRNGAYVAAGDLTGDGRADLVFGAGPGGGPRVLAVSGATLLGAGAAQALAAPLGNFFAGDIASRDGVRVSVGQSPDGTVRVLTSGATGTVTSYAADGSAAEASGFPAGFVAGTVGAFAPVPPPAPPPAPVPAPAPVPVPPAPPAEPEGEFVPGVATSIFLADVAQMLSDQSDVLGALQDATRVDTTPVTFPAAGLQALAATAAFAAADVATGGPGTTGVVFGTAVTQDDLRQADRALVGADADLSTLDSATQAVNQMLVNIGTDIQNTPARIQAQFNAVAGSLAPAGRTVLAYVNGMMQVIGGVIKRGPELANARITVGQAADAFGRYIADPILGEVRSRATAALNGMIGTLADRYGVVSRETQDALGAARDYLNQFGLNVPSVGGALIQWVQGQFTSPPFTPPQPPASPPPFSPPPVSPPPSASGLYRSWSGSSDPIDNGRGGTFRVSFQVSISRTGRVSLTTSGPLNTYTWIGTGSATADGLDDQSTFVSVSIPGNWRAFNPFDPNTPDTTESVFLSAELERDGLHVSVGLVNAVLH